MTRRGYALAFLFAAVACTSVQFEGTENRLSLMPSEVAGSSLLGETVVWGGRVLSLRRVDGGYDLEVMAYPLDAGNRPRLDAAPGGRVVARYPNELSESRFAPGTAVTLAGVLEKGRSAEIDGYRLVLPEVATRRIHPWP